MIGVTSATIKEACRMAGIAIRRTLENIAPKVKEVKKRNFVDSD